MDTVVNQELVIASEEFLLKHPELHHYTDLGGLDGIVNSNNIWATHYKDLNDTSEVDLLHGPFVKTLAQRFTRVIAKRQRISPRLKHIVREQGGLLRAAEGFAGGLVKSLYQVTFGPDVKWNLAPFITSFATHSTHEQNYERDNGLLSQWRGYGGSGGFCIVLDTKKLAKLLTAEFGAYYYVHLNIDAVTYAIDDLPIEEYSPNLVALFDGYLESFLKNPKEPPDINEGFPPFVQAATCYKHQGFREESEARIVAIPSTQALKDNVLSQNPDAKLAAINRQFATRPKEVERRHIALFDKLDDPLPILRILVGPSNHQRENAEKARGIVGDAIPIVCSLTPYIG